MTQHFSPRLAAPRRNYSISWMIAYVIGDFDYDTVLAVTEIRYRYFVEVMGGKAAGKVVPPKSAAVDGISWLPRLIAKARIKLRGEMDPDLMYGCAGDRPFLRKHHMTLPVFLQLVWNKGEDDRGIVDALKAASTRSASRSDQFHPLRGPEAC
jgi:hypothetical protein